MKQLIKLTTDETRYYSQAPVAEEEIDKSHWGELESESESEEESEEESDEDGAEADMTGLVTPGET